MEGEGPLTGLAGLLVHHRERRQAWRQLDPVEQNLRRASHGMALIVFTVGGAFFVYGWRGVVHFVPWLAADPAQAWPGAVFFGGLLAVGLARFVYGVRRVWFWRDGLLAFRAFVKLALGVGVTVYLGRFYPWPGAAGWAAFAIPAVFVVGLWLSVTGAVRFLLMLGVGNMALGIVNRQRRKRNALPVAASSRRWRPLLFIAALALIGGGVAVFFW